MGRPAWSVFPWKRMRAACYEYRLDCTFTCHQREDRMRPTAVLAIVLIAAGIAALAYQGITYTTREKVVDIGSIHVMADKTKLIPVPPVLGGLAIIGGILLLAMGSRKD